MSGQQIGTVIGGAIGAYFGGPAGAQLGMAIGGFVGGAVDPTHINGPKIGDGQQQSATDGSQIAWIQGTAMVAGTIVQVSPRRQIRHKDNGKGGPVQVTYTAVQDFAILVCESSELRGSTTRAVLMVLQDGKLVYDVRPGSTMLADSAKWKANVDFLFGDEAQLPHPTLEAITGVGNTPAYRGSLVAVFKNFDVSAAGDRIPSFQFVVSNAPGIASQAAWRYLETTLSDGTDYSASSYDDSSWPSGQAPFGNLARSPTPGRNQNVTDFNAALSPVIATLMPLDTRIWIRRHVYLPEIPPGGFQLTGWLDNAYVMYVNGTVIDSGSSVSGGGVSKTLTSTGFVVGDNVLAVQCSDDATTGSIKLKWQATPNVMTYASYGTGWKGAGFNLDREQNADFTADTDSAFRRETSQSVEIGFKGRFLSKRLALDIAAFDESFRNFQLNTFLGTNFVVNSVPHLESQGVEVESRYLVGDFKLNAGLTYDEAVFGPESVAGIPLLANGTASFAPRWSGVYGLDYTREIGGYRFTATFSAKYNSDYNTGSDLAPIKVQPAYTLYNGRLSIGAPDESWALELWGQNLTDELYYQVAFSAPFQAGSYKAFLGQPRTVGLTLRLKR